MSTTLQPHGDRWQLRFTRRLKHPPEKVWRAITEAEHRNAWFPQAIEGEFVVGGTVRFVSEQAPSWEGEVLACEPPSLLEFTWGDDTLRFELVAEGDGTTLTLLDTFDEQGKAARDAAGWHACLDVLEYELDGEQPPWNTRDRWAEVHPGYVEQFGPEGSSIGPPEGA